MVRLDLLDNIALACSSSMSNLEKRKFYKFLALSSDEVLTRNPFQKLLGVASNSILTSRLVGQWAKCHDMLI